MRGNRKMNECNDCSMREMVEEIRKDVKLLLADKHQRDGEDRVKKESKIYRQSIISVILGVVGAFVLDLVKGVIK